VKIDSIIRHAITPPAFDRTKLHRERLVDTIHANVPRKLIAIASPPGYGKTLLLADFSENTELPVCWVRLTEADRDVMRFAKVLAVSLQKRFRRLKDEPNLESMASASPEALARAFTTIIDERVSETFVIALDDVHLINRSKPVLEFLDAWLEAQPEQVTLIAAGREVLEVSLAKLMADGDLAGLGPHDLALTRDELAKLAQKQLGVELDERESERLLEETRGWVTGVLLSGMLSRNVMSALAHTAGPMVYEYLASVVLNRQPDDIRRFMLDSAVLPIMTAESCDFVLEREGSKNFLNQLVREGYFVTASGDSPIMYEYHPQFRDFLLEVHSDIDESNLNDLRMKAANYFSESGAAEYSVDLYFEAGAFSRAAKIAEREAVSMFRSGRMQTLADWSERLDGPDAQAPKVFLYLSQGYSDRGLMDDSKNALDKAKEMLSPEHAKTLDAEIECQYGIIAWEERDLEALISAAQRAEKALPKRASKATRGLMLRIKALAQGFGKKDFEKAEKIALEAVEVLQQSGDNYRLATALTVLAAIQEALGNPIAAHSTSQKAHKIWEKYGAPVPLAVSFNNLAFEAHGQGRFEDALNLYNQGIRYARQAGSISREANSLFSQADIFNDLGLPLQAAELYGQGLRLATQIDFRQQIQYGCIQTSVLHRRAGSGDLPHQWLKRAVAVGEGEISDPDILVQLAALEVDPLPEKAIEDLDRLLNDSKLGLNPSQRTVVLYFLSRAQFVLENSEKAHRILEQLLSWVGANGTEQIIAAELAVDSDFREFCRIHMLGSPVMSVIIHRIDTMRALAQAYSQTDEETVIAPSLTFTTLGECTLSHGADRLLDLKPLAREVLIYLVDNGRVDRDLLLETFWPQYPPGRQVSNLYTAIYSLRRALGKDAVMLDGSVYSMEPELNVVYDVARFERAATVAEALPPGDPRRFFAITESINSYGGPFLPEFTSEWVIERRRILEFRYLELLRTHAEEAIIRNQPLRALGSLRTALNLDPYQDDINMRYLETLGLLERRSEIVAHYQQYVQLLSNELGLDPPESVRELYSRLIG
jgi:ATP/maltotriose-dependent transcriptional regulator MalT/DNA-binding SARP family transcriptional activator